MLTYNNHDTFQRSLQSMTQLLLDERVTELLILDNGSHEVALRNLLERTEKMYSKVKVFYSAENLGIAKGRKFLFDECKGEYILSFDSDIVILDADMLLTLTLETFKREDIWLVGGGGGNHPYFPALFRNYIHNLKEADEPGKLTFVEEVAGWFHGFRSKMLVKNGGQIYMDEQFTPFWGEDSDFCMQIRVLGGKCAIFGRGLVGHKWSSCDKKDTQKTIDEMWTKFTDKWYPKFGDTFQFDFDEDFYVKHYGDKMVNSPPLVDYLIQGISRRFIGNGRFLSKLFNLQYEGEDIKFEGATYGVRQFIDKFMNKTEIKKHNFRQVSNKLSKSRFLVMLHSSDDKKAMSILENLRKKNPDLAVCLTFDKNSKHPETQEYLQSHLTNHAINTFVEYHDHLIPNIISFQEITSEHEYVVFLHTDCTDEFEKAQLEFFVNNQHWGQAVKADIRTIDAINSVHNHDESLQYFAEGVFMKDMGKMKSVMNSLQVENLLHKALLIPTKYSLHLTPRQTPRHSLERLVGYLLMDEDKPRTLVLMDTNINDQEEVEKCAKNNSFYRECPDCDIMVINGGSKRHLKASELNCDYYYIIQDQGNSLKNWRGILSLFDVNEYKNVILCSNKYVIEDSISEFLQLGKYSNKAFLEQDGNVISYDIISLQTKTLPYFFQMHAEMEKLEKEGKNFNITASIYLNLRQKLQVNPLWYAKNIEVEDEMCVDYYRMDDKYEPDIDFPIVFDD